MGRPKVRKCKDCLSEGLTTKRPAPHPGPRCSSHSRAFRAKRRSTTQEQRWMALYSLSADEYNDIKELQQGTCAICQRAKGSSRALAVDHDHLTGLVRGLLCKTCNRNVLGFARDDIAFFERCIEYLKNPPAVKVIGERNVPGT